MKSIAIKTNNSQIIEYLQNNFKKIIMPETYITQKKFKHFTNIIIHYKGNMIDDFLKGVSKILSFLVIYEFEEDFLKEIINSNYFYFSNLEREEILENCFNILVDSTNFAKKKFRILNKVFFTFIKNNKNLYLSGFINFRLHLYHTALQEIVEEAVNNFILEREYNEFISLLRLYINSEQYIKKILHVVYSKNFTLILDENKKIIECSKDTFNAKFLSDISFSTNDYTLNTLLTLLPQKIYVHLIDNEIDEFITTLSLIFENRLEICIDCNICNLYKYSNLLNNNKG